MLTELTIENFALVEKQRLSFAEGLNILTGETGAGKSILLDALGMALGERVGAEAIRHGAEKARVEAVFTLDGDDRRLSGALTDAGIETGDDELLLITREVNASGKGTVRINGRTATLAILKSIGDALVDIHGQHEHQSLLDSSRHQDILDNWCGPEITTLKDAVAESFRSAQTIEAELAELRRDARERERTIDLLRFQLEEIKAADPKPDEEEALAQERTLLANSEKLYAAASIAGAALRGGDGESGVSTSGAAEALAKAVRALEPIVLIDESLRATLEMLQAAQVGAEEAARDLRDYRERVEFSPDRLEQVEMRIGALRTLLRKYGEDISAVLNYKEEVTARLNTLENSEERIAELEENARQAQQSLAIHCASLTAARTEAAQPFSSDIQRELGDLAMLAARFEVAIRPRATPTTKGADSVEFLFSANPGEPLRPLAKIASGGEISRVMLAMKSVLARTLAMPTLVFDEIDAGIGGRTGVVIAEKLAALGRASQVVCITHLPQIAARGNHHLAIEKRADGGRTSVSVTVLSPTQRVEEIARMLGGSESETVVQHAREMLAAK